MKLRGREISRLEGFSDAVFAFAATLLVVSLEVPTTFPKLLAELQGFAAFALAFAALVLIWSVHNGFFRRYGLQDGFTVVLNSCLLFIVLFYVFPLKFVSKGIAKYLFRITGDGNEYTLASLGELGTLFVVYGIAFAAVFLCVALMYLHAYRMSSALELTDDERHEAFFLFRHYLIFVLVGLLSVVMAWTGIGLRFALPGWLYLLLGPACYWHGVRGSRAPKEPAA